MCGIAGTVGWPVDSSSALARLQSRLGHRGPDDTGVLQWTELTGARTSRRPDPYPADVTLVHRRLAVIDPSPAGWQPMSDPSGTLHVVFNGEIYNYLELRGQLEKLGHAFATGSDTEVLLASWAQWGAASLGRFVGMFAFALLDTRRRELALVRDPFGIKPLYYVPRTSSIVFASEIPALFELPGVSQVVDPKAAAEYLRFGRSDTGQSTLFAGVRALPGGHLIRVPVPGAPSPPQRYWQPDFTPIEASDLPFGEAAASVRQIFLDNVRLHMRSDVPLGAALSGGVDSSSIVGAMRTVGGKSSDIRAFSYIADNPRLSEETWVGAVAHATSARLSRVGASAQDLVHDLDALIRVQGEPFGGTSIYAQHRVFQLAHREGVTVMLDGQGADEMFAGYHPYIAARCASLLGNGQAHRAFRLAGKAAALPGAPSRPWFLARAGAAFMPTPLVNRVRRVRGHSLLPKWIDPIWFTSRDVQVRPEPRQERYRSLRGMLIETLESESLPALLRYEDRNSMAHSVESRVPFLTVQLVEFVMRLPEEYLISDDGVTKRVLREAMRGIVPDAVLDRRDKIAFETPERQWLTSLRPWVANVLESDAARRVPGLDLNGVKREYEDVVAGRSAYSHGLWRCLNIIRWGEIYDVEWR